MPYIVDDKDVDLTVTFNVSTSTFCTDDTGS